MRDSYTNRKHCPSHEMWSYDRMRGMVVGEGGRSTGVLLYHVRLLFKSCGIIALDCY